MIQAGKPGDLGNALEICTVAVDCQNGRSLGGFGIAVSPLSGDVYLASTGFNAGSINRFDAEGNFLGRWGWDTIASGQAACSPPSTTTSAPPTSAS